MVSLPEIVDFNAHPRTVEPGGKVTLWWEVVGADELLISDQHGQGWQAPESVIGNGKVEVSPRSVGEYLFTLTATNHKLRAEVSQTLRVICQPVERQRSPRVRHKPRDGRTAHERLGLAPGATKEEVRAAYRELAKKHHPDKGGDPERFQEVQDAYDIIAKGKRVCPQTCQGCWRCGMERVRHVPHFSQSTTAHPFGNVITIIVEF